MGCDRVGPSDRTARRRARVRDSRTWIVAIVGFIAWVIGFGMERGEGAGGRARSQSGTMRTPTPTQTEG
jgi:hypothetical protein